MSALGRSLGRAATVDGRLLAELDRRQARTVGSHTGANGASSRGRSREALLQALLAGGLLLGVAGARRLDDLNKLLGLLDLASVGAEVLLEDLLGNGKVCRRRLKVGRDGVALPECVLVLAGDDRVLAVDALGELDALLLQRDGCLDAGARLDRRGSVALRERRSTSRSVAVLRHGTSKRGHARRG